MGRVPGKEDKMIRAALEEAYMDASETMTIDRINEYRQWEWFKNDIDDIMAKYNCGTCKKFRDYCGIHGELFLEPDPTFCCNQWESK